MQNKNHMFSKSERNSKGKIVNKVICVKKGGNFYTSVWQEEKIKRNICPICKEKVSRRK